MTATLLATITGIALADSLNPSLFVAQFYLLTTPDPVPRIVSYIAGVLAVNLGGGLLVLAGFRTLVGRYLAAVPPAVGWGLVLAAGLALLAFGLWYRPRASSEPARTPRSLRPAHTFLLGAAVMLNELTTALPYFVAIERITAAGLGVAGNVVAMLLYNAVFALPLIAFLAALLVHRQRFTAQIARVREATVRWIPAILRWGSVVVGVALTAWGTAGLLP